MKKKKLTLVLLAILVMLVSTLTVTRIYAANDYSGGFLDGKSYSEINGSATATDHSYINDNKENTSATLSMTYNSYLTVYEMKPAVHLTDYAFYYTGSHNLNLQFTYLVDGVKKYKTITVPQNVPGRIAIDKALDNVVNVSIYNTSGVAKGTYLVKELNVYGVLQTEVPIETPALTPTPEPTPEPTIEPTPTVTPSPTPEQPTGNRAILVVTMTNGLEKEFDLPMSEVNTFLNWYDTASGSTRYGIDKHDNNKGPFTSRKDYVIFDKILTFSVDEYSAK